MNLIESTTVSLATHVESVLSTLLHLYVQVVSNEEAVNCIKGINDAQAAAKRLTEEAVSRKSKDDISVIVVSFQ